MRGCGSGSVLRRLFTRSFEQQRVHHPPAFASLSSTPCTLSTSESTSSSSSASAATQQATGGRRRWQLPSSSSLSTSRRSFFSAVHTRSRGKNIMSGTAWDGSGTQEELMYRDECILVDDKDVIVGHDSKYATHRFIPEQPRGQLHRAFSVFLFNRRNELLLQQRAATKVTFPSLWTNTCCSHPLYGYEPTEVDTPEGIADGSVPGVKRAAVRKLQHELGIAPEQVPAAEMKYLTRLHYCAGDDFAENQTMSGGPWGEHEMDYILFIRSEADVTFAANPEEVDDVKWVTKDELREMMDPTSGLRWSPWFRIIAERFLDKWWTDIDDTLATDKHVDLSTIHKVM